MNHRFPHVALAAIVCVATATSAADTPAKVTFDDHVKPIFRQHCASCHHQGEKKGGLALDSFSGLMEGGGSGEIVYDDGDAEASRLWQLVNHDDTPVMPPNQDKMPAEQLAVIRAWIEGGILENNGSKAKAKKKNALAFVASGSGRPKDGGAMPGSLPLRSPVVTDRPAATTAIAASPWAPLIAIAGQKQIVLYHADTNALLGILPFEEGVAQSLRFSSDGSFLIASGGEHSAKGLVAVYNVKTGQRVASVGDELDTLFDGDANDAMTRIAMGGPLKMLRIYDATDGSQLFDLKKHTDWIYAVAFSPDGVLIASGDRSGGLCVWEAETGRLYLDLTDHKGAIHAVAWRDDSNMLASASEDGTVKLWDMVQGKVIKSITAHGGGVTDVAFDHQGRLVTAGKDNRVKLWDASGNHVRDFEPMGEDVLEATITHDGKRVVYGDWNGVVLTAVTDDPKQKAPLASNPPPAEKLLEAAQAKLAAAEKELPPLKSAMDAANQAVAAAKIPVDQLNTQVAANRAESTKAASQAEVEKKRVAAIDQELPNLTAATRDLFDAVVVARVGWKANATDAGLLEKLAAQEQALAGQLMKVASKRRERISAANAVTTQSQLAAAKKAEADKLAATMPPLQEKLTKATAAATSAKQAHDQAAARINAAKVARDKLSVAVK